MSAILTHISPVIKSSSVIILSHKAHFASDVFSISLLISAWWLCDGMCRIWHIHSVRWEFFFFPAANSITCWILRPSAGKKRLYFFSCWLGTVGTLCLHSIFQHLRISSDSTCIISCGALTFKPIIWTGRNKNKSCLITADTKCDGGARAVKSLNFRKFPFPSSPDN